MSDDLISREALKKAFEDCAGECACCVHNTNDFEYCGLIDNAPTVEPEITEKQAILLLINNGWLVNHDKELREKWERPHGEWLFVDNDWGTFQCDQCKKHSSINYNYCPNCGADMRGGEDGK